MPLGDTSAGSAAKVFPRTAPLSLCDHFHLHHATGQLVASLHISTAYFPSLVKEDSMPN